MPNEIDSRRLIEEVRKRPALWDLDHEFNKWPLEVIKLWKEVAAVLGVEDVEQCRHKWKILRDTYRTLVKRFERRKARDRALGIQNPQSSYDIKWAYYDDLSFIKDKKRKRRTRSEMEQDQNTNSIDDCNEAPVSEIKVEPTRVGSQEAFLIEEFDDDDDADMTDMEFQDIGNSNTLCDNIRSALMPEQESAKISDINEETYSTNGTQNTLATSQLSHPIERRLSPISVINAALEETESPNVIQKTKLRTSPQVSQTIEEATSPITPLTFPMAPAIKVATQEHANSTATPTPNDNTKDCPSSSRSERHVHFLETPEQKEHHLMKSSLEAIHSANKHNGDPDYHFLVSFLKHTKKMDVVENLRFRRRMCDLVMSTLAPNAPSNAVAATINASALSAPVSGFVIAEYEKGNSASVKQEPVTNQ
uniref:MADF domain-containing protein n=1 Tax=Musca domestica TaxID=7370 RepID=A0A1I8MU78_MUSDO